MRRFRVPMHMHVTNWSIVAVSLVAIALTPWNADNLNQLASYASFALSLSLTDIGLFALAYASTTRKSASIRGSKDAKWLICSA